LSRPDQILLSDLLRHRVRCDQGLDHGPGVMAWMHPPVHRLLGWVSRPSALRTTRAVWRLDQWRGLSEQEAFVKGPPAEADLATLERLPTLMEADLLDRHGERLGSIADLAVVPATGQILHYLVCRSDPRLPGSSRWRLSPDRIVDQQPGQVTTALRELDELPLARASVRQDFLRRSRHWREQLQQMGDRAGERLEGWLEEPPWEGSGANFDAELDDHDQERSQARWSDASSWDEEDWGDTWADEQPVRPDSPSSRRRDDDPDPWI
jgi:hypothetical protein